MRAGDPGLFTIGDSLVYVETGVSPLNGTRYGATNLRTDEHVTGDCPNPAPKENELRAYVARSFRQNK